MRGGTAFASIDDITREQRIARCVEAHAVGAFDASLDQRVIQMRLRQVEIEPGRFETKPAQPVRLGLEELAQGRRWGLRLIEHCSGT
jgi:NADP-dependent 3-hydroxy acid dehydrogenase YdfG